MNNIQKQHSLPESAPPSWLIFVSRAEETAAWLRLMIVNPVNGAMSVTLPAPIEVDPLDPGPGADDLPVDSR